MGDSEREKLLRHRAALRQQRLLQRQSERMQVVGLSAEEAERLTRSSAEDVSLRSLDSAVGAVESPGGALSGEGCSRDPRRSLAWARVDISRFTNFLDFLCILLSAVAAVQEVVNLNAFLPEWAAAAFGVRDSEALQHFGLGSRTALWISASLLRNPFGVLVVLCAVEILLSSAGKFSLPAGFSPQGFSGQPQLRAFCAVALAVGQLVELKTALQPTISRLAIYTCCCCCFAALLQAGGLALFNCYKT